MRARAQQSFFWIERGSRPIRAAQHAESDTSGVQTGHAAAHWALRSRYMYRPTFAPNRVQCIDSDWELASLHCRRVAVAVVASRWEHRQIKHRQRSQAWLLKSRICVDKVMQSSARAVDNYPLAETFHLNAKDREMEVFSSNNAHLSVNKKL